MSHTPAPWRIEVIHVTEGAYTISHGTNRHGDGPEGDVGKFYGSREDARLIAAAPQLLDALHTALPFVEDAFEDEFYKASHVSNAIKEIMAAINKARGQS